MLPEERGARIGSCVSAMENSVAAGMRKGADGFVPAESERKSEGLCSDGEGELGREDKQDGSWVVGRVLVRRKMRRRSI